MLRLSGTLALALVVTACSVRPVNPFDPETPPEAQAQAQLAGSIQAVVALAEGEVLVGPVGEGEVLVEASFCAPREGDHSGFDVVLRELASDDGDSALLGRTETTSSTGEFVFNLPAGQYSLEFIRAGFEVPLPRTITIAPGESLQLEPLCALSRVPPERPALGALPALVDGDNTAPGALNPARIEILNCSAGNEYRVTQTPEGVAGFDPASTTVILPGDSDPCATDLLLSEVGGGPSRTAWRVEVVAVDALGNESAPATAFIVRDTLAPPPPAGLVAVPGRDRLSAEWAQPSVDGDDDASAWLVSYGLTARPDSGDAACPFGAPASDAGDDFDTAAFAVEGPSPVPVVVQRATLSGILEGTTVFVQVAARDAAGNLSCWSAPAVARPDVVAPALVLEDDRGLTASSAAFFRGHAAFARGSAGLSLFDPAGAREDLTGITADDVDARGRFFAVAGGAAGLHRVEARFGAAAAVQTFDIGEPVHSALSRPGALLGGTDDGYAHVSVSDGASSSFDVGVAGDPTRRLLAEGPLLFLLRQSGRLQVVHRAQPGVLVDERNLGALPAAAVITGDELWVAVGPNLRALDFSRCFALDADCLDDDAFVTPVLAGANPVALRAWDDLVLAAVTGGDLSASSAILALRPQAGAAPLTVGAAFAPGDEVFEDIEPRDGGFCGVGAFGRACFDTITQPFAEAPRRLIAASGSDVRHAVPDDDSLWLLELAGGDAFIAQLGFDGALRRRAALPQLDPISGQPGVFPLGPSQAAPNAPQSGVGLVTLDQYGRAFALAEAATSVARVDVDLPGDLIAARAEIESAADSGVAHLGDALVDLDGADLLVAAVNPSRVDGDGCAPLTLARVAITEDSDGALEASLGGVLALPDASAVTQLLIEGGRAFVSVEPFAVHVVDLADLSLDAAAGIGGACADAALLLRAFGVHPIDRASGRLLIAGGQLDAGGSASDRFFTVADDLSLPLEAAGEILTAGAVGRFLAVAPNFGGALLFEIPDGQPGARIVPAVSLPAAGQVSSIQPTRRGIVLGDGAGGAVLHVLR